MEIYLVRHGEAHSNIQHLLGRSDSYDLTDLGYEQSRKLATWLQQQDIKFDGLFASSSNRAYQTCTTATEWMGSDITISDDIREICRGDWDGKSVSLVENCAERLVDLENWKAPGDEAESLNDVENRMLKFLETKVFTLEATKRVGIFSHGKAIASLVKHFTDVAWADLEATYNFSNTCVSLLKYNTDKQQYQFEFVGKIEHLHE
eukprot:TRINITY_DN9123_c0_g1_i1.p1 TRINITY_DN9123_c0_g1~~TRINITY_DN9123_c0_g1_i1.p1  ORF type:complete len:205 (+),score=43.67 TRINITY_DN9123_c0_g1_i1:18-632(+)